MEKKIKTLRQAVREAGMPPSGWRKEIYYDVENDDFMVTASLTSTTSVRLSDRYIYIMSIRGEEFDDFVFDWFKETFENKNFPTTINEKVKQKIMMMYAVGEPMDEIMKIWEEEDFQSFKAEYDDMYNCWIDLVVENVNVNNIQIPQIYTEQEKRKIIDRITDY